MRRFFALLAVAALSASAGCTSEIDQSTRPENLVGTYHLVSWGSVLAPRNSSVRTAWYNKSS